MQKWQIWLDRKLPCWNQTDHTLIVAIMICETMNKLLDALNKLSTQNHHYVSSDHFVLAFLKTRTLDRLFWCGDILFMSVYGGKRQSLFVKSDMAQGRWEWSQCNKLCNKPATVPAHRCYSHGSSRDNLGSVIFILATVQRWCKLSTVNSQTMQHYHQLWRVPCP